MQIGVCFDRVCWDCTYADRSLLLGRVLRAVHMETYGDRRIPLALFDGCSYLEHSLISTWPWLDVIMQEPSGEH
jgi:hypothetical protein